MNRTLVVANIRSLLFECLVAAADKQGCIAGSKQASTGCRWWMVFAVEEPIVVVMIVARLESFHPACDGCVTAIGVPSSIGSAASNESHVACCVQSIDPSMPVPDRRAWVRCDSYNHVMQSFVQH